MTSYAIIRFYHPSQERDDEIVCEGLTLEEAQAHCKDPATRKDGVYFDGYSADDEMPMNLHRR